MWPVSKISVRYRNCKFHDQGDSRELGHGKLTVTVPQTCLLVVHVQCTPGLSGTTKVRFFTDPSAYFLFVQEQVELEADSSSGI